MKKGFPFTGCHYFAGDIYDFAAVHGGFVHQAEKARFFLAEKILVAFAYHISTGIGERTVLDLLEAEQDVLDAQSALVIARRDRIVTAYRLAAALGLLVPESLGFQATQLAETAE